MVRAYFCHTAILLVVTTGLQFFSVKAQCTTGCGCQRSSAACNEHGGYDEVILAKVSKIQEDVATLLTNNVQPKHPRLDKHRGDFPHDCADIYKSGEHNSGEYTVYTFATGNPVPFQVWCDMDTAGGGWLVFQRRKDGSVDFNRPWIDYAEGFGNISREFWLGNHMIHSLTDFAPQGLRVDLQDHEGISAYAQYGRFAVASQINKFALNVSSYKGDAGDSLSYHSGMMFTSKDQDNDENESNNCAMYYGGAWWFKKCYKANLNGPYKHTGSHNETKGIGVDWNGFRGHTYSLKFSEMKMRPINF